MRNADTTQQMYTHWYDTYWETHRQRLKCSAAPCAGEPHEPSFDSKGGLAHAAMESNVVGADIPTHFFRHLKNPGWDTTFSRRSVRVSTVFVKSERSKRCVAT
jgi:hypothetical protein